MPTSCRMGHDVLCRFGRDDDCMAQSNPGDDVGAVAEAPGHVI